MKKILVTGGGGFVGKSVAKMAAARGIETTVIGRNSYPEVEKLGIRCVQGDIRDASFVKNACRDVDTVFHVAAIAGIWGPWQDYYSINVLGTENIINSCRENKVPNLVYTSTPSVVFNRESIKNGDESLPYPETFLCNYARSKVMAEKMILAANSSALSTCALRPHLIWGPGDPHLVPRLLEKGRRKQLRVVGNGNNLVDISYIENVAHAHLLAGDNLSGPATAAGKPYFISQGQPVNLWDWINDLYLKTGIEPVTKSVPFTLAYYGGAILETMYTVIGKRQEPKMTRFLAEQLAKSHYFSIANIERDLGYRPVISTEEGMEILLKWIKNL
ncbi:NAD-dependent epimerase/dehydratase family protein [Desulfopila sp. IMCC35008]|uniref:NAD-dependent epimerase/dehydratase family protein n=1 Tax=Desulfopila sp. IMCC35008 TaxID=2653858 RepID=UPI0013D60A70|nr:NAD-dependent epimerase/dehydratase family protein [Desulfopila sp. IMCC35008]